MIDAWWARLSINGIAGSFGLKSAGSCTIRFCAGMMQIDENDLSDVWIQSDDDFSSESWARQMERLDGDMLLKDLVKLSSRQARVPCAHMRKAGVAGRCVFSVCRS